MAVPPAAVAQPGIHGGLHACCSQAPAANGDDGDAAVDVSSDLYKRMAKQNSPLDLLFISRIKTGNAADG